MKKIISLLMALVLCASFAVMLTACDEDDAKAAFEELNEEEWEQALSAPNFENVTIKYEYTHEDMLNKQVAKFTKEGVYRSIESLDESGKVVASIPTYFTGDDANIQRNLFLQTFLSIVEKRDNFEYDKENDVYIAESASARIDQAEGIYVEEDIKNGKLSFNDKGNVQEFVCTLTESVYMNGELQQSVTIDVVWTFSDYGTTVITAEEQAAK